MAYDQKKDYARAIDDAIAAGASDAVVAQLNDERNEKIAANQDYYHSKGISAGDAYGAKAQEYINSYQSRQNAAGTANTTTAAQQSVRTAAVPAAQSVPTQSNAVQSVPAQSSTAASLAALERNARESAQAGKLPHANLSGFRGYLDEWLSNERQRSDQSIDRATTQGVNELARVQEDAKEQYQVQLNQIDADERRALDNQALRNAIAFGGRSGVGEAQYNSIMNTAAQNRVTVNNARTKLTTDVARQIADLRAQGEYQKADAALQLANQYLQKLWELEQWGAEYNLSVDQFNAQMDQYLSSYLLQLQQMRISTDQWERQFAADREDTLWNRGWMEDERAYTRAWNEDERAYSRAWNEDERAYNRGRDTIADQRYDQQYADSRADTAWSQGMTEKQYADNRADTLRNQALQERQYADSRADTAWNQGMTERQYADNRADTLRNQALQEQQYADSRADTARKNAETAKQLAYSDCVTMLNMGIMPDSASLRTAGISENEAKVWVSVTRQAMASSGVDTSGIDFSGGGGTGSSASAKGSGTSGTGTTGTSGGRRSGFEYRLQQMNGYLNAGNTTAAQNLLNGMWDSLTSEQQKSVRSIFTSHGLYFTEVK